MRPGGFIVGLLLCHSFPEVAPRHCALLILITVIRREHPRNLFLHETDRQTALDHTELFWGAHGHALKQNVLVVKKATAKTINGCGGCMQA